ncbi:MAG: LD-carboxypeptidase [Hyphomonadaceae bacterium]
MIDRRHALLGLGFVAGACALSPGNPAAAAPTALRKPQRLREGDTVGLIVPASPLGDRFDMDLVKENILAMGLKPKIGAHALDRSGYLAGDDEARAGDVNAMFADKDVKAIFAVRGGWGCARILPHIDWDVVTANPKLLLGYSDITALHMATVARAGFGTVHGPNANSAWGKLSWENFRAVAFDGATPTYANPVADADRLVQRAGRTRTLRSGKARGRLLGGNLTIVASLMGTPWLPDFDGAILFLEDVDEAEYRIDRMLTQLALGGVLGKVAGVVFGQCTDCKASGSTLGGFTLSEVLEHHFAPLGVPVFQGLEFGHIDNQFSLPVGVMAEIDADAGTLKLLEPAVV